MNKKARSALHALRSARANGALDQTEVQFLDLIEGLVPEHSPNDPKLSTPRGPTLPCGGMTVNYVDSGAGHPVEPNTVYDSSAEHWSPWLPWHGGPCPLPGDVPVDTRSRREIEEYVWRAGKIYWGHDKPDESCRPHVVKFRYRSPDPAGWVPRGKFIPPAELWDEGCPVRCEWTCGLPSEGAVSHLSDDYWDRPPRVQYIRLVARQPQAGLPEFTQDEAAIWDVIKGWDISRDGRSYAGASGNDAREIAKAVRAVR